jgi:hypothetical protein
MVSFKSHGFVIESQLGLVVYNLVIGIIGIIGLFAFLVLRLKLNERHHSSVALHIRKYF